MTRRRLSVAVVVATLALASCASSPPLHYYTLTTVPASGARVNAGNNTVAVRVDRITIPTELDRSQLVRRIDATRLEIVEDDRWAAPLEDTIRRVLSDDLAMRLAPEMVANPFEPSVGEKRQSLAVDIGDFYGDSTCAVTLRASWVLRQPDSQSTHGSVEAQIPAGDNCTSAAIPAAMSQALGLLADKIAAAIAH